jgi:hypothetical protein
MRNHWQVSILALAAAIALAPTILAQTTARSGAPGGNRDLSGIWTQGGNLGLGPLGGADATAREIAAGRIARFAFSKEEPPMQPWAAERYRANREGMEPPEIGRNERNQALYPYCLPEGMPRVMTIGTFEVVHAADRIYLLHERNHNVRRIYLDDRKHLEGMAPSFLGTSHGRWDGDTLVVETGNILSLDGYGWLDTFGHPFTDALRVTERFRRTAPASLQVDFVFDDPGAYTRPWTGVKVYELQPDDYDPAENIICYDHLQEDFLRDLKNGKPAGRP